MSLVVTGICKTSRKVFLSVTIVVLSMVSFVPFDVSAFVDGEEPASPPVRAAGTHEETPNMEADVASIPAAEIQIDEAFGKMPLYFIENQGQQDERVAYYVQGVDKSLYFAQDGITIVMSQAVEVGEPEEAFDEKDSDLIPGGETPREMERWVLKLDLVGANVDVRITGEQRSEAMISYFHGKPEDWHTGVPTYTQLVYKNLWEGIDLVFSGTTDQLKYEFRVQPGADPEQIQLAYRGAEDLRVNLDGQLEVVTGLGTLEDEAPIAWQERDGEQVAVDVGYLLEGAEADSLTEAKGYGFELGAYDPAYALVIDPTVIIYAGYIGGSGSETIREVAVDASGAAYVVGYTPADESSFPVVGGPDLTHDGTNDAFVAKVKPDGSGLEYCGYIGGNDSDSGTGIAVDASGAAYVVGYTWSDETSFPVVGGPDLTFNDTDIYADAFVVKVKPDGSGLEYAGYIGGTDADYSSGVAVDASGAAYVVGNTRSNETSFPVVGGPDLTLNGGSDAYVAKVKPDGSGLEYAGYIGGTAPDYGYGIALDANEAVYVVGITRSKNEFPVVVGPDLTHNGGKIGYDAYVAKVRPGGSGLEYAGYIGGSEDDWGNDIAVDTSGAAYVVGHTYSDETSFPVVGGPDLTYNDDNSGIDAFVAKVRPDGSGLEYSGYIGGSEKDEGHGIAVDTSGSAYVVGETWSDETSFPVVGGPDLTYNYAIDAFITKVQPDGSGLVYAGYIGGTSVDSGRDIAVDANGAAYVAGYTGSDETSFPVVGGPDLTYYGPTGTNTFVAKIEEQAVLDRDLGFRPYPDGYSFNNYGDSLASDFTIDDMRYMFGDSAVCLVIVGDDCVVRNPTGILWRSKILDRMTGGHCFGMASTSMRFYMGSTVRGQSVSQIQPGAVNTYDLDKANIRRQIAYYYALQSAPAIQAAYRDRFLYTPSQILDQLRSSMIDLSDPVILAIFQDEAGHALTPYAIEQVSGDIWRVKAYDNNVPDIPNLSVLIDTTNETWSYPTSGWSGNASSHSIGLVPTSAIQEQAIGQCDWCGDRPQFQISIDGTQDVMVRDSQGRRIGYMDGVFTNEIPEAYSYIPMTGTISSQVFYVPNNETYSIQTDGRNLSESAEVSISQFGEGFGTVIDTTLDPNEVDQMSIASDGMQVEFTPDAGKETSLTMAADLADASYSFEVSGIDAGAAQPLSMQVDHSEGRLVFNAATPASGSYDLDITRASSQGEQPFKNSEVVVEANDTQYVYYAGWDGEGEMHLEIDHGSDGSIDEVKTLENEAQSPFGDVPTDHELYAHIRALYDAGYTSGCSTDPLMYCPDTIMNRSMGAVFMLRGQFGSAYTPAAATGALFADMTNTGAWDTPFAEAMYNEGLSAGCGTDPLRYCPVSQMTRQEASVFGLRLKYGMSYSPPPATGTLLADMTNTGSWATQWCEQAYLDGLLPECGWEGDKPLFCPEDLVDRGWGAYLVVEAKGLLD